jgi:hypothetical protein
MKDEYELTADDHKVVEALTDAIFADPMAGFFRSWTRKPRTRSRRKPSDPNAWAQSRDTGEKAAMAPQTGNFVAYYRVSTLR